MRLFLSLLCLFSFGLAEAATLAESFTVKQVNGQNAVLEGKTDGLKAGDQVYFARSPFHFTITEVKGDQITISLPSKSDVGVGQIMVRQPTPAMKKAMDTEDRLKKALED